MYIVISCEDWCKHVQQPMLPNVSVQRWFFWRRPDETFYGVHCCHCNKLTCLTEQILHLLMLCTWAGFTVCVDGCGQFSVGKHFYCKCYSTPFIEFKTKGCRRDFLVNPLWFELCPWQWKWVCVSKRMRYVFWLKAEKGKWNGKRKQHEQQQQMKIHANEMRKFIWDKVSVWAEISEWAFKQYMAYA